MTEAEIHKSVLDAARHQSAGRFAEAESIYREVLACDPRQLDALQLLGALCAQTGRRNEGIGLLTRACALNPSLAVIHNNLGTALRGSGQLDAAMTAYRRAIELDPLSACVHNDMGIALRLAGRLDEALAEQLKALELKPDLGDAWTNLGLVRAEQGNFVQALADSQKAVEFDPTHARAHLNLSMLFLKLSDFERGWCEYEWRWKCAELMKPRGFIQPRWDGSDLDGRTILLHSEQGLGDTLQFVRYAPMVAGRGGRVILECQAELFALLQGFPGIDQMVRVGQPLPAFDLHCPLLSLPYLFATRAASIPAAVPYVKADPRRAAEWRQKVDEAAGGTLKVGLAWAGNPAQQNDRNRSMSLVQFAPLAATGATFFSVQKGPPAAQAANPPAGMRLIDFSGQLRDFSDTAALVENLDLVISTCTAPVHLAGAMGKPTWALLNFNPDWRWFLNRDDSPWYPTMRLFWQRSPGKWEQVMERVAEALWRIPAPSL